MFLSGSTDEAEGLVRIKFGILAIFGRVMFPMTLDVSLAMGMADVDSVGSHADYRTVDTMEIAEFFVKEPVIDSLSIEETCRHP